jgi:hypothetical protein
MEGHRKTRARPHGEISELAKDKDEHKEKGRQKQKHLMHPMLHRHKLQHFWDGCTWKVCSMYHLCLACIKKREKSPPIGYISWRLE